MFRTDRVCLPVNARTARPLALLVVVGMLHACASVVAVSETDADLEPVDALWSDTPEIGSGPHPLPPDRDEPAEESGEGGETAAPGDSAQGAGGHVDDGEPADPGPPPSGPPPEDVNAEPEEDSQGQDDPGGGGTPAPSAPPPPAVACTPIGEGLATVFVRGVPRFFNVQLPADRSRMAMLFLWHGFLEIPTTFAGEVVYDPPAGRWRNFDPNAFPMPLMIVTPFDTKMLPPLGLDWDIVSGDADIPYFDAMMQCIHEQFAIDDARIYSFGFSAGAVFSNLLAALRPHLFAATISESGTWFNDPPEQREVLIDIVPWRWPAFNPADGGNILLTHGGPNDFATIISLENATQHALPFLYDMGRTVTECRHDFGHTRDPDLTEAMYYEWMWAHWLGGPPIGGLPPSFPVWPDRIIGSTFCTFHPAP